MRVDVLTAVHAAYAHFLPSAWASLQAQRHPDWTWLVQVDGPPHSVLEELTRCGAASSPRVRIEAHETQDGPAVARNIALGRSSAPLVQNLDADDELEADALTVLGNALDEYPAAGFAVGQARDLHEDGELRAHRLAIHGGTLERGELLRRWLADPSRVPVHPAGVLWRRSLLLRLGGWAALNGMEDTGLLMAASAAGPGVYAAAPILRYRRHPGQRSAQSTKFRGGGVRKSRSSGNGRTCWRTNQGEADRWFRPTMQRYYTTVTAPTRAARMAGGVVV